MIPGHQGRYRQIHFLGLTSAAELVIDDIDAFRSNIFENNVLDQWHLDSKTLDTLKNDDVKLLRLGHLWNQKILLGDIGQE
jgi:hypothetical protein